MEAEKFIRENLPSSSDDSLVTYVDKSTAKIMDFAVDLAADILVHGGELWRVELIVKDILEVYDFKNINLFMLPHTIILSTQADKREPVFRQREVGGMHINSDRLSQLNRLIRKVKAEKPDPDKLAGLLNEARESANNYSRLMIVTGMAIALASLNFIIGGTVADAVFIALGIYIVMGADLYLSAVPGTNKMLLTGVGTFLIGIMFILTSNYGITSNMFHLMVITSIGLIPGIPLINACREVLCGRILGGALLFATAFIETLAVVCGYAVAISVMGV